MATIKVWLWVEDPNAQKGKMDLVHVQDGATLMMFSEARQAIRLATDHYPEYRWEVASAVDIGDGSYVLQGERGED